MNAVSRSYEMKRLRLIAAEACGDSVLDIGHAQFPNPYLEETKCTGFDLQASPQCDYAEQITGDIRDIAGLLYGRKFETVIAAEFIEHVEDPYTVIRNLHGLIAPGGRLIISTPNPVAFPTLICEWIGTRRFFYTQDHTYYFPPRWMIRLLERCDFRIQQVRPVGLWPFGVLPTFSGWSYQVIYIAIPSDA
ncbi:class I SAM-dependent methyltransferase [Hyphococcus sp.]|uniref:class I SAM-dependent methyltransferase n=1 Tax=Hyphococcus sp. TaxID=2038636 RepID=UPI003CCB7B4D